MYVFAYNLKYTGKCRVVYFTIIKPHFSAFRVELLSKVYKPYNGEASWV